MSIKTMFIAPYPSMIPLVEECKTEYESLDIQIEVGNLEDGVEIAKWAEKNHFDVIISRGGTAQLIKKAVSLPVIDVHLSGYDMLRTLMLANDFNVKKALVGFANITLGAQSIIDLLDLPIAVYSIQSANEVEPLVHTLKEEGFELILGDVVTVDTAQRSGLEGVLIQSGREAIFEAFKNARSEYEFHQGNQVLLKLLAGTLNTLKKDVLILDSEGVVVYETWHKLERSPFQKKELKQFHKRLLENRKDSSVTLQHKKKTIVVEGHTEKLDDHVYTYIFFEVDENAGTNHPWMKSIDTVLKPVIITESDVMRTVMHQIQQSMLTQKVFVLNGGQGTGKELLAKYIHFERRNPGSFVKIDAGTADWNQLTGAIDRRASTIYFTNTDDLEGVQLEGLKAFIRDAIRRSWTVVVSCTAVMPELIDSEWEKDAVEVAIPSLDQRKEDINGLATFFIAHFHQNLGTQPVKIRKEAIDILKNENWPGNVTELKQFMKSLVLSEKGYVIEDDHVQKLLELRESASEGERLHTQGTLEEIEQQVIRQVLEEEGFNQSKAANRLGINRSTLWRKLQRQ